MDTPVEYPRDLEFQAEHVAKVTNIRRYIVLLPEREDGTRGIGLHSRQYLTERGLLDAPVLYETKAGAED